MKRKLAALLICSLVAGMTACGGGNTEPSSNEASSSVAEQTTSSAETVETGEAEAKSGESWLTSQDWGTIEKKDTPLEFLNLGLPMPLKWNELVSYVSDSELEGRSVWERGMGNDVNIALASDELTDAELAPCGFSNTIKIDGREFAFSLGETEGESYYLTYKECLANDRFVLTCEYADEILAFFGLPESIIPENQEKPFRSAYWLINAVIEKYGKPDYVRCFSDTNASFASGAFDIYWERGDYYFGLTANEVLGYDVLEINYVEYISANAWNSYFNEELLVPFDEFIEILFAGIPNNDVLEFDEKYRVSNKKPAGPVDYPEALNKEQAAHLSFTETETEWTYNSITRTLPVYDGTEEGRSYSGEVHEGGAWHYDTAYEYQGADGNSSEIGMYYTFQLDEGNDEVTANAIRLKEMVYHSSISNITDNLRDKSHVLLAEHKVKNGNAWCSAYKMFRVDENVSAIIEIRYDYAGEEKDDAGTEAFKNVCAVFGIEANDSLAGPAQSSSMAESSQVNPGDDEASAKTADSEEIAEDLTDIEYFPQQPTVEEQVIYDEEGITIAVKGLTYEGSEAYLTIECQNNT